MAAFHNIETMFFAKCSNRICPIFPSLFPYYKTTTSTNPLYLQKEIQFCLAFLLKHGKKLSKIRFTSINPFLLFLTTGPDRVFFPLSWDFPLDVGGITGVQQMF